MGVPFTSLSLAVSPQTAQRVLSPRALLAFTGHTLTAPIDP